MLDYVHLWINKKEEEKNIERRTERNKSDIGHNFYKKYIQGMPTCKIQWVFI